MRPRQARDGARLGWYTGSSVIAPETIALVRDRTDIVAVVSESVPSLKRRGRSFVGLCPFHKEKTGSFHVNPDRGFFHCFGCKESGSVIDFVMKEQGYTFPEAVRMLAERAGIPIEEERRERTEVDRAKKQKDDLFAANQLAATFFEQQLREHPLRDLALDELARRGIVPGQHASVDDALQAFRIGYAPAEWDGLTTFFKRQGISPIAGESVGLLVPRSSGTGHYDRFRHRLMFAVVDPQGRVVAFSGRALADPPNGGNATQQRDEKPAKYINSPESPIYSKGQTLFGLYQARHAVRQEESAIVVEGNFDVFSLHARGVTNVVAPLGTAFTVDQAKLLKRYASNVTLLFDGDAAGRKAVRLSREPCAQAGLSVKVASLPEGVDPDDYARTKGIASLSAVIAQGKGMLEFLIDTALDEGFSAVDMHEKFDRIEQVAKLLAVEDDPLVRMMAKGYADRLAGRLDIHGVTSFQALEEKVRKAVRDAAPRPVRPAGAHASNQSAERPERARIAQKTPGSAERREMVGALIEHPPLLNDPEVQTELALLEGPGVLVVAALKVSLTEEITLDTTRFLAQIPPAIQAFASERLAAPRHEDEREAKANLLLNAHKLRSLLFAEETSEDARENYRDADWDATIERAREASERLRKKHRVK
jgi:DNA primase